MTPSHETSRWTSSSTSAITFEYGPDSYGGETGATLGRVHAPAKEIVTLEDYRQRHGQYKSDAGSLLMRTYPSLRSGMIMNHRIILGWGARRTTSPAPKALGAAPGSFAQAYYEWMPLRDAASPRRGRTTGATSALAVGEPRHLGNPPHGPRRAN